MVYWIPSRQFFYHVWLSEVIVYDSSSDVEANFRWNEEYQVAWELPSAHSSRLWRLFAPLHINVTSSFHYIWHKKSGSSTVLCRSLWQNFRERLLFPGYSPSTEWTWEWYSFSSCSLYQIGLWERPVLCVTQEVLVNALTCTASTIFLSFCTLCLS